MWLRIALLAMAYLCLAQLSLRLTLPNAQAAIIWPVAGLAMAAMLMLGRSCWPGICLGSIASSLTSLALKGELGAMGLAFSAMTALGVTLQAVIGARVLAPLYLRMLMPSDKSPLIMTPMLSVPLVCFLSATAGTGALYWFQGLSPGMLGTVWLTWWAGDSLGVLLVMPLALVMAGGLYRQQESDRAWTVLLLPLLTVTLAISGYYWLARSEQLGTQQTIVNNGQQLHKQLTEHFARQKQTLEMVADFIAASTRVTEAEFAHFTRRAVNDKELSWLGWAPRETGSGGEAAYPLQFFAGQAAPVVEKGLDLGSVTAHRVVMRRAVDSAQPVQLPVPRSPEQGAGGFSERLVFIPVYHPGFDAAAADPEARRGAVQGFVVGALTMGERFWAGLADGAARQGLTARLSVELPGSAAPLILWEPPLSRTHARQPDWVSSQKHSWVKLELWTLSPWQPGQTVMVRMYLVGIVLAVLFATLLSLFTVNQQLRVRRQVALRTAELSEAKGQLQLMNAHLEKRVSERSSQLLESERFMRALIDALSAHIAVLDEQGVIVATNESWRMFARENGQSPEWVGTGVNYLEACDRSVEGEPVARLIREVIQGSRTGGVFEYPCHSPDRERWFLCRVTRFKGDGPLRVVLAHEDITPRKRAERRTRELADELLATLQAVPDVLFDLGADGRYHGIWSRDDALLAAQREELLGRTVPEMLPEDAARTVMEVITESIGKGRSSGHQIYLSLPDGGRWFELSAAAKRSHDRQAERVLMLARDITDRKRVEAALQQLNDELEQRVLTRTEQLQQARHEAEEASQAKSVFLTTMSHEIRTPLNGVIGMIEVLEQTPLEENQQEMSRLIHESALSLLNVIDDVLDLSKIEAGRLELEQVPFSVADMVETCCLLLDNQATHKGVELTLFTDPDLPHMVMGDELRLRQVLLNLVSNAIKFSSERQPGKVSVRALLAEQSAMRVMVELQVADNGIGMDARAQRGLFTAFRQADASTTRRFGGSGLGLAISHQLIRMMQGEVQVSSEPGKGSLFTVTLPLSPASGDVEVQPELPRLDGVCCLVIGAETSLAGDICSYLAHAGARVAKVSDIHAAHDWQQRQPAGRYVWICDPERQLGSAVDWGEEIAKASGQELGYVLIERGRRRTPRWRDAGYVAVDGNLLTRQTLLTAVVLAGGGESCQLPHHQPEVKRAPMSPPNRAEALRQGPLLLVAEDNEANQKVLLHQLTLLGYRADIAEDGARALGLWRNGDYALLLTDLHMPEMDGYQLTAEIRARQERGKRLPIIALTANALKGEAERCLEAGMDDYLSKPVRLESLQAIIEKWLPGKGHAPEPPVVEQSTTAGLSPPPAAPVDASVLAELVGDEPAIIAEFLADFRRYGRQTADELLAAYRRGEVRDVGAIAHKLKSSACSVGAVRLSEYCAGLESAGRAADSERVARLIPAFSDEMAAVELYIDGL